MCTVQWLWVVLALVACSAAEHCQETCIFTDVGCMTSGIKVVYDSVVSNDNGSIRLDPLHMKKIVKKRGSTKYTLTNIKLIGLKNCESTKLGIIVNETIYKQYLSCPQLISTFDYEAKDESHTKSFQEKRYKIVADNYDLLNQGQYRIVIEEKDHQPHGYIESVHPIVDLKGNLKYNIKHLCDGHKPNESQGCIKHNKKTTAKYLNYLIIKKAMRILVMIRMQGYHKKYTLNDVFPSKSRRKPACGSLEFVLQETFSTQT